LSFPQALAEAVTIASGTDAAISAKWMSGEPVLTDSVESGW
jgi:hypothetical protein